MTDRRRQYSVVLAFVILVGCLAGLYLIHVRNGIEQAQNRIENIVDYDAVMRAASYEKRSVSATLKALERAGVTAMAVYDRNLEKANDVGDVKVLRSEDVSSRTFYGGGAQAAATYVAPVAGREGYFKEIQEDLVRRLGADKVIVRHTDTGPLLELMQPYTSLAEMKLSISRLQAEDIIRHGFNVVARPSNFKGVTASDVDFVFDRLQGLPRVTGMVFVGKEALGYPDRLERTTARAEAARIPIVGIEATTQLQYDTQAGFDKLAYDMRFRTGRLYTIAKDELKKLTPEEVAQRFYVSDVERNIRFNLFPIYEEGTENRTALGTSIAYMAEVKSKLEARGYILGAASVYPAYSPSPVLRFLVLTGAAALFTFTAARFIRMRLRTQYTLFGTAVFASLVIYVLTGGTLLMQVWALSAAITAPVAAMVLLMDCWRMRAQGRMPSPLRATCEATVYLVVGATLAAVGGIYIASLLGSTQFFMEFALFRGVKLTFIAPVILTAIAYLQRFPLWKGRTIDSPSETKRFLSEFMQTDVKIYTVLAFAGLLAAAWVFIGRSGHTAGVPVPAFELELRRFLENTMYARPREKEFLIGHPALMLAGYAALRRWPTVLHFLFTTAGVIGIGSMVETFCHVRTPVMMSIMRGVDGVGLGILAGILAILLFRFLMYGARLYAGREVNDA